MKKIIGFIILIAIIFISRYSYFGVVNDKGEKVTNIQEIMQQEKMKEQEKTEQPTEQLNERTSKEEKNIESQTTEQKEIIKTVPKTETKIQETAKVETKKQETPKIEEKKQETVVETKIVQEETSKKVEENKKQEEVVNNATKCATGNHGMGAGNTGKWFNTKAEAIAEYEAEIKKWGDKWTKFEIDDETYYSNCPSGYEVWTCPYCNKWTLNYYK